MNTYCIITGKIDGQIEELFGSFDKDDCTYELESEKDLWKDEGYKSIKITTKKVEEEPDKEVYGNLEAKKLTEQYIEANEEIIDIDPDLYEWNLYDIQGYVEDNLDLDSSDVETLKNRVKALKAIAKAYKILEDNPHTYS